MALTDARTYALLGKAEATVGTDPTPTPALNAIRCMSKPVFSADYGESKDESITDQFGDGVSKVFGKSMSLEVQFYLRSGGGKGVRPDFAPIIECSNHNVVSTANTSVLISLLSGRGAARKTSTFYWYEDGLWWKFVGAMANLTAEFPMDGNIIGKATILAPYLAPLETALPAGLVYQSSDPITVLPTDVVTDSGVVKVGSFGFDSSIAVSPRRLIGEEQVHMDSRAEPMITLSKSSLGTPADYNRLLNSSLAEVKGVFGAAGNRLTLTAPQGQYKSVAPKTEGVHQNRDIGISLRGRDNAYSILID